MTITNEKRREVAARLREKHSERQGMFEPQSLSMQALNTVEDLLDCIPVKRTLLLDLADLIEPEERVLTDMELAQGEIMLMGDRVFISGFGHYTKEYTCQNKAIDSSFKCSECNSFVEGNDYAGSAYICDGDWNFCPNCGRKVVD